MGPLPPSDSRMIARAQVPPMLAGAVNRHNEERDMGTLRKALRGIGWSEGSAPMFGVCAWPQMVSAVAYAP